MTPQEQAEIKARHVAQSWQDPGPKCDWDFMRWPCDAARLLARIEELEKERERMVRRMKLLEKAQRRALIAVTNITDAVKPILDCADALAALGGEDG